MDKRYPDEAAAGLLEPDDADDGEGDAGFVPVEPELAPDFESDLAPDSPDPVDVDPESAFPDSPEEPDPGFPDSRLSVR